MSRKLAFALNNYHCIVLVETYNMQTCVRWFAMWYKSSGMISHVSFLVMNRFPFSNGNNKNGIKSYIIEDLFLLILCQYDINLKIINLG